MSDELELTDQQKADQKELEDLQVELDKLQLRKKIKDTKNAIKKTERDIIATTEYLEDLVNREKIASDTLANSDAVEKARESAYQKLAAELKDKFQKAEQLINVLLQYIEMGRLSKYRDLDSRLTNDDLDCLAWLVIELKKERETWRQINGQ